MIQSLMDYATYFRRRRESPGVAGRAHRRGRPRQTFRSPNIENVGISCAKRAVISDMVRNRVLCATRVSSAIVSFCVRVRAGTHGLDGILGNALGDLPDPSSDGLCSGLLSRRTCVERFHGVSNSDFRSCRRLNLSGAVGLFACASGGC